VKVVFLSGTQQILVAGKSWENFPNWLAMPRNLFYLNTLLECFKTKVKLQTPYSITNIQGTFQLATESATILIWLAGLADIHNFSLLLVLY